MPYTVRAACFADAEYLSTRLRKEDEAEIAAASGRAPLDCLREGISVGRAWVGVDDEGPIGIFGVIPSTRPFVGWPWMLATERLVKHQRQFLKECAARVTTLHRDFTLLTNFVDARNHVHIRWLTWCGFEFMRLHKHYGVERRPFYEFQRVSNV